MYSIHNIDIYRYNYAATACLMVLLHDFLDHLDGIVAKVQKTIYGHVDDPILGAFMDAFCDKVYAFRRHCCSPKNIFAFFNGGFSLKRRFLIA